MKKQFVTKHPIMQSLIALLLVFSLTACGSAEEFEADRYVKGYLDAMLEGEFADYKELTQTSESSLRASYQNRIRNDANTLISSFLPDSAAKEEFFELFKNLYGKCRFKVGKAAKKGDSYLVPVTTHKIIVFKGLLEESVNESQKEIKKKGNVSNSDARKLYLKTLAKILKEHILRRDYAEAVTITVSVTPTQKDSKIYTIADSECQKLFHALMDVENLK